MFFKRKDKYDIIHRNVRAAKKAVEGLSAGYNCNYFLLICDSAFAFIYNLQLEARRDVVYNLEGH